MKKIIYTRPDGGLSVVHPVINTIGEAEGFTESDALARALAKLPADAINPQVVDADAIPADRTFRNAWAADGKNLTTDMDKAREIHKDTLRELRAPKLALMDIEVRRAERAGNTEQVEALNAKYQLLLDVTSDPRIASAKTPETLKAVIPAALE